MHNFVSSDWPEKLVPGVLLPKAVPAKCHSAAIDSPLVGFRLSSRKQFMSMHQYIIEPLGSRSSPPTILVNDKSLRLGTVASSAWGSRGWPGGYFKRGYESRTPY